MRILGTENGTLQKAMHEQVPHMALHRAMLFQRSRMSCAKKHENLLEGAVPLRGSPPYCKTLWGAADTGQHCPPTWPS